MIMTNDFSIYSTQSFLMKAHAKKQCHGIPLQHSLAQLSYHVSFLAKKNTRKRGRKATFAVWKLSRPSFGPHQSIWVQFPPNGVNNLHHFLSHVRISLIFGCPGLSLRACLNLTINGWSFFSRANSKYLK